MSARRPGCPSVMGQSNDAAWCDRCQEWVMDAPCGSRLQTPGGVHAMTFPLSAQAVEAAAREMHDIALLLEEDPPTQEWHEMSPARQQGMLARAERVLRAAIAAREPSADQGMSKGGTIEAALEAILKLADEKREEIPSGRLRSEITFALQEAYRRVAALAAAQPERGRDYGTIALLNEQIRTMPKQPALVVGQVWKATKPAWGPVRTITDVCSEGVFYVQGDDQEELEYGTSWTAWRDWQQRHAARVVEGGKGGT